MSDFSMSQFVSKDDMFSAMRNRIEELERELAEASDRYTKLAQLSTKCITYLEQKLAAEKARLSDDEEYQGYRAVNVDGQLYVHTQAHDDAWEACKAEKSLADRRLELLKWAHETLIEINPNNYSHDDICNLNAASVEVILGVALETGDTHGKTPEWWAAYRKARGM